MGTSFVVPASCLNSITRCRIQNAAAMWLGFWHNHPTRLGEMEKRGRIPNILFQSKYFYGCSKNVSCAQWHGADGFHSFWWKGSVCKKGGSAAEAWCGTKTARAFKSRQPFWCTGSPLSPSWFILRHQLEKTRLAFIYRFSICFWKLQDLSGALSTIFQSKAKGSTPWMNGFRFMFAAPFNNNRLAVSTVQRKQLKQPSILWACLSLHVAAWSLIHCDRSTPNLWTKYLHPIWIQIARAHFKLHFLQVTTLQKEGMPNLSNNQLWPTPFWDFFPGPTSNNLTLAALLVACVTNVVWFAWFVECWKNRGMSNQGRYRMQCKNSRPVLRNKQLWPCR